MASNSHTYGAASPSSLPAITTTNASSTQLAGQDQDSIQPASRTDAPSTPPHRQLATPMFVVTPSSQDVDTERHSPATTFVGDVSANGVSPVPSLVYSAQDNSNANHPPSPTLSSVSTSNNSPRQTNHLTLTPSRNAGDPNRYKGHSPTKSVDSAFHSYLEKASAEAAAKHKAALAKNRDQHPTFTALDGPRASLQEEDVIGSPRDQSSSTGAGAGGKKVKRKGVLGKIPILKRFAKTQPESDDDDESDDGEAARDKGSVVAALPDPSESEMGQFYPLVPSKLNHLIDPKNLNALTDLGGESGIVEGLHTDKARGLSTKGTAEGLSIEDRRRIYGENRIPQRKPKSLLQLMWIAFQDKILILLSVAAVVSLALGIYQSVGRAPETYESPECPNNTCEIASVEWVEGVAIIVAIVIVVLVGSVNDYQKELQFRKLNAKKDDRQVKCIRDGTEQLMSVYDIVVGDVCVLEPGEVVPVDGIFLQGHNVKCDESSATGESDAIKKLTYNECKQRSDETNGASTKKMDPFLLSGSKVAEGSGTYAVIGVGQHSFLGKIMMSLQGGSEETPLQLKLNRLAEIIAKCGASAGLILFISLMIRFFTQLDDPGFTSDDKAQSFISILIIAVTIIVVAVPEGLPLAVTLALAFATTRMTKQNLLVRVLSSCETMGTSTVICTDKTGTLTQNKMTVVAGSIGVHLKFAERLEEHRGRTNANSESTAQLDVPPQDFSRDITEINDSLANPIQLRLNEAIAINSTAFEGTDEQGNVGFVGSKTETALLQFAKDRGWAPHKQVKDSTEIVEAFPFSSERKAMATVVKTDKGYRAFVKGASEVLFKLSTSHVHVKEDTAGDQSLETVTFNESTKNNIDRTIIFYANQSLRTIAVCYRDFESWPPVPPVDGAIPWNAVVSDLTLLGIMAIEDPLREGVINAVQTAQGAGVAVKMCTGDNVLTARSIATQCGIYTPGGVIMEGPAFRKLTHKELLEVVPRLQVLARSSPTDKQLLVNTLKEMGEVVGVTGDGANDAPALKAANVGFSMGIAGTEVAKEASDIILMDDNFASIVTAISWGRCVNDSVKKFLQFQISVNITAVLLTYISAVASDEEESVLSAVQLLWVNLIMDTFAALALATDPASPDSLKRKPDKKLAPLISADMWKMIVGQSIFQLAVALVLHFRGADILGYHAQDTYQRIHQEDNLKTLVFNQFVFCQIFNQFNARELGRQLNVFKGIHKNYYFMVIFVIMVGGQALIVNVGGTAFQVTRIGGNLWAISIIIGLVSLPIGILIRLIPTAPIERAMIKCNLLPDPNALPTTSTIDEDDVKWAEPFHMLRGNLKVYSNIRGGRIRASSIVKRSTKARRLEEAHIYPTALMAMVPSMVMATVGGGWRPEGELGNPAAMEPSRSSTALYMGAPEVHPDTEPSDPIAQRFLNTPEPKNTEK